MKRLGLRSDPLSLYRLSFTLLFLLLGAAGLTAVALHYESPALLAHYLALDLGQPLWLSLAVGSSLSLFCGLMSARFCLERRHTHTDRRRRQLAMGFPDRRSGIDRRTGQAFRY